MSPVGSRACLYCFVIVLIASSLLPASSEPSQAPAQPQAQAPAPQHAPSPSPSDDDLAYKIGPGDTLRVFVWKEPELSGELDSTER
jgi:protein involved in polysaccharide export with SLBB domain